MVSLDADDIAEFGDQPASPPVRGGGTATPGNEFAAAGRSLAVAFGAFAACVLVSAGFISLVSNARLVLAQLAS